MKRNTGKGIVMIRKKNTRERKIQHGTKREKGEINSEYSLRKTTQV